MCLCLRVSGLPDCISGRVWASRCMHQTCPGGPGEHTLGELRLRAGAESAMTHCAPPPSVQSLAGEAGIPGGWGLAPPGTEGGSGTGEGGGRGHGREGLCLALTELGRGGRFQLEPAGSLVPQGQPYRSGGAGPLGSTVTCGPPDELRQYIPKP